MPMSPVGAAIFALVLTVAFSLIFGVWSGGAVQLWLGGAGSLLLGGGIAAALYRRKGSPFREPDRRG